jgi:putative flippase GtrA
MAADPSTTEPGQSASPSFLHGAFDAVRTKGLKYSAVSVFNLIFGQLLIFVFVHRLSEPDGSISTGKTVLANTLSVIISAVPAYYMSRAWVWGKRGKSELMREVIPFWIFVFVGWLISTFCVAVLAAAWPAPPGATALNPHKLAINVVSIGSFGILWIIRFFWMDKAFHLDHHASEGPFDVLLAADEPVEPDPVDG